MTLLAVLLSLILALPGGAVELTAAVSDSGVLSEAAQAGLQALLDGMRLTISPEGFDVTSGEETLLWARLNGGEGTVVSGSAAAPLTAQTAQAGGMAALTAQVGRLLGEQAQASGKTVDLQEAGTARRQLVYTLTGAEWAAVWPDVTDILCSYVPGAEALREMKIQQKGVFKRYFSQDGAEIGAYFYTAAASLAGATREIRLEYGYQPERGLYLTFRCPDAAGDTNLRIALHARNAKGVWTLKGELRRTAAEASAVYSISGKTNGKLTLESTEKNGKTTVRRGLTLQLREREADFVLTRGGGRMLSGTVRWQAASLPAREMPGTAEGMEAVSGRLAGRLLAALTQAAPDSWQQILHYLAGTAWIDAQGEETKP